MGLNIANRLNIFYGPNSFSLSLILLTKIKMHQEISTLKWKHAIPNITSSLSDLSKTNIFSDVTLVSDDKVQFQAHKSVLSATSTALKNVLLNNPHPHPLIYLRGVGQEELRVILQLIYLGEASIYHSNIKSFIEAANSLEIKPRTEGFLTGNAALTREEVSSLDIDVNSVEVEPKDDDIINVDTPAHNPCSDTTRVTKATI